ncbi:16981_t:CDS:2, partial [Gigaspora margarita]
LLQNCKPKLINYDNNQTETKIKNINFDNIITIFDDEKIIIDYDYNNEVEVTINAKQIKVNQFIETNRLIYKREQTIEAIQDLVQKHTNQVRVYNKQTDINMNNKLLNFMFGNQEQSEHNE